MGRPGLTEWPVVTCMCLGGWAQAKTEDAKKGVSPFCWNVGSLGLKRAGSASGCEEQGRKPVRRRVGGNASSRICARRTVSCTRSASPSPPAQLLKVCSQKLLWELSICEMNSIFTPSCILFPEMFLSFLLGPQLCFHKF